MNKLERIAENAPCSPREIDHTPLLARRDYDAPSVFLPESLLREARRQSRRTRPVPRQDQWRS